jgi:LacI family transcriptional regulator
MKGREELRKLATLEDVALKAGTFIATAGRALGGYGQVARETHKKIVRAAKALDYNVNGPARGLVTP